MTKLHPLLVSAIAHELKRLEDMGVEKYLDQWDELDKEYERCITELTYRQKDGV